VRQVGELEWCEAEKKEGGIFIFSVMSTSEVCKTEHIRWPFGVVIDTCDRIWQVGKVQL
jgi:hypothetical protein